MQECNPFTLLYTLEKLLNFYYKQLDCCCCTSVAYCCHFCTYSTLLLSVHTSMYLTCSICHTRDCVNLLNLCTCSMQVIRSTSPIQLIYDSETEALNVLMNHFLMIVFCSRKLSVATWLLATSSLLNIQGVITCTYDMNDIQKWNRPIHT